VVDHFKVQRKLLVTDFMAERAIREVGSALPLESRSNMLVRGTNLIDGSHTEVEITDIDLTQLKAELERVEPDTGVRLGE